jgi:hypothetical protein
MDALAVDAQLLRAVLTPDISLTVGRALSVRVAELLPGGRGTLSLAGVLLEAELPKELEAGQELRLVVREVTPTRIVLGMTDTTAPAQEAPPIPVAPVTVQLPGGGSVYVKRRDQGESAPGGAGGTGGDGRHTLALTYGAPHLGAVDMQFALDPSSLRLVLTLAPGPPFELAEDASDRLRSALADAVGRQISVVVQQRREPLDVYA